MAPSGLRASGASHLRPSEATLRAPNPGASGVGSRLGSQPLPQSLRAIDQQGGGIALWREANPGRVNHDPPHGEVAGRPRSPRTDEPRRPTGTPEVSGHVRRGRGPQGDLHRARGPDPRVGAGGQIEAAQGATPEGDVRGPPEGAGRRRRGPRAGEPPREGRPLPLPQGDRPAPLPGGDLGDRPAPPSHRALGRGREAPLRGARVAGRGPPAFPGGPEPASELPSRPHAHPPRAAPALHGARGEPGRGVGEARGAGPGPRPGAGAGTRRREEGSEGPPSGGPDEGRRPGRDACGRSARREGE